MSAFVQSSAIVDLAMAIVFAEIVLFTVFIVQRRSGFGLSLVLNGLSGLFLLLALKSAWLKTDGYLVAAFLAAAALAHSGDVLLRLRR